jgi:hypothetical protein
MDIYVHTYTCTNIYVLKIFGIVLSNAVAISVKLVRIKVQNLFPQLYQCHISSSQ